MRLFARSCLAITASLLLTGSAYAQSAQYSPRAARTHAGDIASPLTTASTASPASVLAQFLRASGIDVSEASLVREGDGVAARNGLVVFRFSQAVAGVKLYGAYAKATFTHQGELVYLVENLASALPSSLTPARVSEEQALRGALARLYPGQAVAIGPARRAQNSVVFGRTPFFHAEPKVTRVAFQAADGTIRSGHLVETWSDRQNLLHHTLVGASGEVLFVEQRTSSDSYNVFINSPRVGTQTVVEGPAPNTTTESPAGWLAGGAQNSVDIAGNNVHSYLDVVSNNQPDKGGIAVADGNFLTAVDLTQEPSTTSNRDVAVQNLFFLNNRVHDVLYAHGFTEAAGNFQENNLNRGGLASDSVNAEAQDGKGENNANFATPVDGNNPRMQVYLWTGVGEYEVVVTAPASVAGSYKATLADFGSALRKGISGGIVVANDGAGTSPTDACEPLASAAVSGKIVLADRGTCTFVLKAQHAQAAGAIGLLVANNTGGTDIAGLGGTDNTISIPVMMISQNDGARLKPVNGVQATLQKAATAPLHIDATLDSDVVFHEYGHGLTWRMIGGMSGPIAGALGEGASDVVAMLINGDDRIGEYSATASGGIRRAPYATYPNTYADITGTEVHADGELYAAIMWRLSTLLGGTAAARDQLLSYFVDAMNFIPATPSYEDMRSGLLAAAPKKVDCLVWNAFASYGVGVGSSAVVGSTGVTVTESFAMPAECK
jgi:extracellular elastinolytic metalloproteinase